MDKPFLPVNSLFYSVLIGKIFHIVSLLFTCFYGTILFDYIDGEILFGRIYASLSLIHSYLHFSPCGLSRFLLSLIWNDLCQLIFAVNLIFAYFFQEHPAVQAASTMHQSDILGLIQQSRTRANMNILRQELSLLRS
jgi:hypothetical protein